MRTVEFQQQKSRGPVVQQSVYSYVKYDDADYERMFYSIKLLDGNEADRIRAKKARDVEVAKDKELIEAISLLIETKGEMIQGDLVESLMTKGQFSRRKIVNCLKRWSCPPDEGGVWRITIGQNNSKKYALI